MLSKLITSSSLNVLFEVKKSIPVLRESFKKVMTPPSFSDAKICSLESKKNPLPVVNKTLAKELFSAGKASCISLKDTTSNNSFLNLFVSLSIKFFDAASLLFKISSIKNSVVKIISPLSPAPNFPLSSLSICGITEYALLISGI